MRQSKVEHVGGAFRGALVAIKQRAEGAKADEAANAASPAPANDKPIGLLAEMISFRNFFPSFFLFPLDAGLCLFITATAKLSD